MLSGSTVRQLGSLLATVMMAVVPLAGRASDGITDSRLEYPAVAGYYEFFVYLPEGVEASGRICRGVLYGDAHFQQGDAHRLPLHCLQLH